MVQSYSQDSNSYYTILDLPFPHTANDASITPQEVRSAYRRALLLHHPDRVKKVPDADDELAFGNHKSSQSIGKAGYTVDQIIEAYGVLVDPISRSRYDKELRRRMYLGDSKSERAPLETFDLDDLDFTEVSDRAAFGSWSKSCRCGGSYQLNEQQLEDAARAGESEIILGCSGCSLSIRVHFDVVEDNDDELQKDQKGT